MPRPTVTPAARVAKTREDLGLTPNAITSALKAIDNGDSAALLEACKFLESVGCYGRRTAAVLDQAPAPTPAPAAIPGEAPAKRVRQDVLVHGPNLVDQSKGGFVVHAVGCADNRKVRTFDNGRPWKIKGAKDRMGIVADVYEDFIFSNEQDPVESFETDLHFCPCVKLPRGNPDEYRAD